MKKQILTLGLMCAAAFALTNCDKQSTEPQRPTEGTPFEIIASTVDTKTTNEGLHTNWAEGDALNVFHAIAGTSDYGDNVKFTYTGEGDKFTSELYPPTEGSYDWYALYPYSDKVTTPAATSSGWIYVGDSRGANQKENNSTEHLCGTLCPLYGVSKNVSAGTAVAFNMHHLTSVVKIGVTNTNDTPLKVSTIIFTATEDIVGTFYVNFADPSNISFKSSSTQEKDYTFPSATLNVTNGAEIAKNETAYFYIPIKPFTAASGSELVIKVNNCEKSLKMPKDVIFNAGEIKAVSFNYDKTTTPDPDPSVYATTYTSNVTFNAGDKASDAKVIIAGKEYDAMKVGTSSKEGSMSVTVPAGTKKLHIHAVGWKNKSSVININGATVDSKSSVVLTSDTGIANESPFTLSGEPTSYYYELSVGSETTITFTSEKGKTRFVIFGVNAE